MPTDIEIAEIREEAYPGTTPAPGVWRDEEPPVTQLATLPLRDIQTAALENESQKPLTPRQQAAVEARRIFEQAGKARTIPELLATGIAPLPYQGTHKAVLEQYLDRLLLDGALKTSDAFAKARGLKNGFAIWMVPVMICVCMLFLPLALAAALNALFLFLLFPCAVVFVFAVAWGHDGYTQRPDREWGWKSRDFMEAVDDEGIPEMVVRFATRVRERVVLDSSIYFKVYHPVRYGLRVHKHDVAEERRDIGMLLLEHYERDPENGQVLSGFTPLAQW